jgi:hypothetical protein
MKTPASTLRLGVADMLGGALLQSFFQPKQNVSTWVAIPAPTATRKPSGLMARLAAYRAERRRMRELAEVSAMARRYAQTMPSLSAELQAIVGRDRD